MKFISGVKKLDSLKGMEIKIPFYHRASISFFNNSKVYYITRTFESHGHKVRELILTSIIPNSWHLIRKLTINLIDSPGVIYLITTKLKELKINVNIQEALSNQIGAIHTITLLIDLYFFLPKNNFNIDIAVPAEAIEIILKELKALKNKDGKSVIDEVYISELTFLGSISNIKENTHISNITSEQFRNSEKQYIYNQKGKIKIDDSIIKHLDLIDGNVGYYSMFSDTEEKYIKILFFDTNQTIAFIDVYHQDTYGAISEFTKIIYNTFQFNIIASYSHQQMQKDTAHWFALIDISKNPQAFYSIILEQISKAKYTNEEGIHSALSVFLVEVNSKQIPEDVVLKYGQNKLTREGETTTVYEKKIELISKFLESKELIQLFIKHPSAFIKDLNLSSNSSTVNLIQKIIETKKSTKKAKIVSISIKIFGLSLTIMILSIATTLSPYIKVHLIEFIHGSLSTSIVILSLLLYYLITSVLQKKYDKWFH